MPLPKVLKDLLTLPTAPFLEAAVMDYLVTACRGLAGVKCQFDKHGNLLAHYRHGPRTGHPLAFVAHTDHPGFAALAMVGPRTVRAAFRGGVKFEYFKGAGVRFWSGGHWVRGKIVKLSKASKVPDVVGWTWKPEEVLVRVPEAVSVNAPGMWDLPDPVLKGDLVVARGCDDVGGTAALLAMLQRLSRTKARGEVYVLFTRAEEVGFVGAIAAARTRTLPKRLPVISIETSSTLPSAPIGAGPILRVGDRAAVFAPALTAYCDRVARDLAAKRKSFQYQRKLMDGGTCEAVAFIAHGYEATGICVALGNYHNMDKQREKIGSESISLRDWQNMVEWFVALVTDTKGRGGDDLRAKMDQRYQTWEKLLHA